MYDTCMETDVIDNGILAILQANGRIMFLSRSEYFDHTSSKFQDYPGPSIGPSRDHRTCRPNGAKELTVSDRFASPIRNLGHDISDQTVGHVQRRFVIKSAPKHSRNTTNRPKFQPEVSPTADDSEGR
jgi:hypothetical protein